MGSIMTKTPVEHGAAGSAAGILFQLERALYWLAESADPASTLGVETYADVFLLETGSPAIHEEDKHSVQPQGHPFGDHDKRLWRTLEIWCDSAVNGAPEERAARLLLVTNRPVPACLARRLHEANQEPEISACVQEIKRVAASAPAGVKETIDAVTAFGDEILGDVIQRMELWDGTGVAGASVRRQVIGRLHLPAEVDGERVVDELLGWLHFVLLEKWRDQKPGWIKRAAFDKRFLAIVHDLQVLRVQAQAARLIPVDPADVEKQKGNRFVQHLAQVEVDDALLEKAITDYLRFGAEHLRLLDDAEIGPADWTDRGDRMRDRWQHIAASERRKAIQQSPEQLGHDILDRTLDPDYQEPLAGHPQPEPYLTRGQYHRLAEVDQVWWYPCGRPEY